MPRSIEKRAGTKSGWVFMVGDELDYLYDLNQPDAVLFPDAGVEVIFQACE